jgi:outer membrane protein OmpA-like peptidoglycan-associated protein
MAQEENDRILQVNGDGIDGHLFRSPVDSKGFISVNGSDVLGHLEPSLGFVLDYGYGLMPLNPGHGSDYMINHSFQGTFQFNLGLLNWIALGLSFPVVVNAGGEARDIGPGAPNNYIDKDLDAQGIGHVALHAKIRILDPRGFIGLAVLGQAGIATGANARNFTNEPGFFYWPQVIVEKRLFKEVFRIGLNAGYRGHTGKNPIFTDGADGKPQLEAGHLEGANLLTAGGALGLRALDELDVNAEAYMTYQVGGASDPRQKLSLEVLGGIKLFIQRNSYFTLGGGAGITPGFQASTVRAVIGFVFEPTSGDVDKDGVPDDEDDCPTDPEDKDGWQDTKADSPPGEYGCPDPDNDGDGILDGDDSCRDVPEDKDGDRDTDGCPEGPVDGDKDGDGIRDSRDKCPEVPEDKDAFEDEDGCPELDNDQDGIPDSNDLCPMDPEDKDGFEDENGCPEPDNDRDGIPDATDKCPVEPEVVNGLDDEDGCPDKSSVVIEGNDVIILEKINFKIASTEIKFESLGIVEMVAKTLIGHPEFVLVEVGGHADETDEDNRNLKLTQLRAEAIVEALVQRGVPKSRLRAMGYGEYCPLDPGHNKKAYEKNRRVEFKVLITKDGPTNAEVGCERARSKGVNPPPLPQSSAP